MVKDKTKEQLQRFIPIAIVGVGALFAGARNVNEYWRNILEKRDLITDIPKSHWLISDYFEPCQKTARKKDKIYAKRGSFIEDIEFDPVEFGIPPSTLPAIDTSQLLSLIVAKQVLKDVSHDNISKLNLERTSVIVGVSVLEAVQYLSARTQRPIWENALRNAGLSEDLVEIACDKIADSYPKWQEDSFPGLLSNVVSGRIANRFNLGGTNCTTDAACASSLAAILSAVNELQAGTADMVITGGVDSLNDILMYKCFSIVGALSSSSHCKPFSNEADGTLLGEGIALFALKRLDDAESAGDKIYGVIKGIGTSSDGRSKSIYAPVSEGQSKAVLRTYERAGYDIRSVGLIEAHGTGTVAGDMAEYNGLLMAFRAEKKKAEEATCALGSVKSQLGHTKSAAGAAGLLKALLAIRHKTLPATLHVDKVNSKFDQIASPLYINTETRPWIQPNTAPRRAGVSCFGFGGSNFHLTLEEYKNPKHLASKMRTLESELIIFTGKTQDALAFELQEVLLPENISQDLAYLAYQSQLKFQQCHDHAYRVVIVVNSTQDLANKVKHIQLNFLAGQLKSGSISSDIYVGVANANQKTALCFADEGNQYINVLKELLLHFDCVMNIWENYAPDSISRLIYPVPVFSTQEKLNHEKRLQESPLLPQALAFIAESQLTVLDALKIKIDFSTGFGLGELFSQTYTAEKSLVSLLKKMKAAKNTTNAQFQHSVKELYSKGVRVFISIGPNFSCEKIIKESLTVEEFRQVHCISLDQQNVSSVTQLWHATAKLICLGQNPAMLSLWQDYVVNKKETAPHSRFTLTINGTNYQKPYPREKSEKNANIENASHNKLNSIPKAFQNAMRRESSRGAECTNQTMSTETNSQRNRSLKGEGYSNIDLVHTESKEMSSSNLTTPPTTTLLQELQRQLVDVHNNHQNALVQSHLAFLNTFSQLANPAQSNATVLNTPIARETVNTQVGMVSQPHHVFHPTTQPVTPMPPIPQFTVQAPPVSAPLAEHKETATPPDSGILIHKDPEIFTKAANTHSQEDNAQTTVMNIIVEKTGYPLEMLNPEMDIEADLGIDSIKRVEILSTLREKKPDLPEIPADELSALKTLQDIINYIDKQPLGDGVQKKKLLNATF